MATMVSKAVKTGRWQKPRPSKAEAKTRVLNSGCKLAAANSVEVSPIAGAIRTDWKDLVFLELYQIPRQLA